MLPLRTLPTALLPWSRRNGPAYVEVDNGPAYVAAAEGSAQASLASGDFRGVSIRVSARLDGEDGYFSYDAQYPADVTYAYVEVYDSGGTIVILGPDCRPFPNTDGPGMRNCSGYGKR
jgi:hypothetical protein